MVQIIKSVKNISGDFVSKPKSSTDDVVYFDDNSVLMEETGGYVSNNLLGISSTLGGVINMDGVSLGASEVSVDSLYSKTNDILNGE